MESCVIPKTVDEAVKAMFHSWGWDKEASFRRDTERHGAQEFALSLHNTIGRKIRNEFGLWNADSELHKHCLTIGLKDPDEMSHRILTELHKYATEQFKK